MKTIKEKVLFSLGTKGLKRKEVTFNVLVSNGTLKEEDKEEYFTSLYKKYRGYYSVNFLEWENDGLITRKKGLYKLTKLGQLYLNNRDKYTAKKYKKAYNKTIEMRNYWYYKHRYDARDERNILYKDKYEQLVSQLSKLLINN